MSSSSAHSANRFSTRSSISTSSPAPAAARFELNITAYDAGMDSLSSLSPKAKSNPWQQLMGQSWVTTTSPFSFHLCAHRSQAAGLLGSAHSWFPSFLGVPVQLYQMNS